MTARIRIFISVFVALILGALGLVGGLEISSLARSGHFMLLRPFKDAQAGFTPYYGLLTVALCALGLVSGVILGPLSASKLEKVGDELEGMPARDKVGLIIGILVGLFISAIFALFLLQPQFPHSVGVPLTLVLALIAFYLSIRAAMSMKDEFAFIGRPVESSEHESSSTANCKILDTNIIIDGRIADLCRTGFLEGTLYIPGFVLEELQHIADSSDSLKRARGRRGLDILNAMQKELPLVVRSWDKMLERTSQYEEVDSKLVKLAKVLQGVIVTNDFNLNKVAALQGVTVLNVNELANALKPVVLPGEVMNVGIVKEGKESDQGVAYLEDGTMIVVEDGRRSIGSTIDVIVTTVLQTVAGKMIFARTRVEEDGNGNDIGRENSSYRSDNGGPGVRRSDSGRSRAGKKI